MVRATEAGRVGGGRRKGSISLALVLCKALIKQLYVSLVLVFNFFDFLIKGKYFDIFAGQSILTFHSLHSHWNHILTEYTSHLIGMKVAS